MITLELLYIFNITCVDCQAASLCSKFAWLRCAQDCIYIPVKMCIANTNHAPVGGTSLCSWPHVSQSLHLTYHPASLELSLYKYITTTLLSYRSILSMMRILVFVILYVSIHGLHTWVLVHMMLWLCFEEMHWNGLHEWWSCSFWQP